MEMGMRLLQLPIPIPPKKKVAVKRVQQSHHHLLRKIVKLLSRRQQEQKRSRQKVCELLSRVAHIPNFCGWAVIFDSRFNFCRCAQSCQCVHVQMCLFCSLILLFISHLRNLRKLDPQKFTTMWVAFCFPLILYFFLLVIC